MHLCGSAEAGPAAHLQEQTRSKQRRQQLRSPPPRLCPDVSEEPRKVPDAVLSSQPPNFELSISASLKILGCSPSRRTRGWIKTPASELRGEAACSWALGLLDGATPRPPASSSADSSGGCKGSGGRRRQDSPRHSQPAVCGPSAAPPFLKNHRADSRRCLHHNLVIRKRDLLKRLRAVPKIAFQCHEASGKTETNKTLPHLRLWSGLSSRLCFLSSLSIVPQSSSRLQEKEAPQAHRSPEHAAAEAGLQCGRRCRRKARS